MNDQNYYFFIHPSTLDALKLTAKERWKIKYRTERLKRQGKTLVPCKQEVGQVNGMVFIQTELHR